MGAWGLVFSTSARCAHSSQTSCHLQPLRLLWIHMPLIVFEFAFLFIFNPAPFSQPHRPASAPTWGFRAGEPLWAGSLAALDRA